MAATLCIETCGDNKQEFKVSNRMGKYTTIARVHWEPLQKVKTSSELQLCGEKCPNDVKGQRSEWADCLDATEVQQELK